MATKHLIPIEQFCALYHIEISFIHSLTEFGLVEISLVGDREHLHEKQIRNLERMMRMYYDLHINMEGIEAISHILSRVDSLQAEVRVLKNRLNFYEDPDL